MTYRQRFAAQIERITHAVHMWTPRVLKYGAFAFGGALMVHAGAYLITGTALFA